MTGKLQTLIGRCISRARTIGASLGMDGHSRPPRAETAVDARKYAALALGLGMARVAILDALNGEDLGPQRVFQRTASARIANALGFTEGDLAIDWTQYLTPEEVNRITGRA